MRLATRVLSSATALAIATGASAGPAPIASSHVTVSYKTTATELSGDRDFAGGVPGTPLDAPFTNVRAMNSINDFGRRTALLSNPSFADALGPDESLISHAFFKKLPEGFGLEDFFPNLDFTSEETSRITVRVDAIHFDEPVDVRMNTVMLHVKWNDQVAQLSKPYVGLDDHFTVTPVFRDQNHFEAAGIFASFPAPNFVINSPDVDIVFGGLGTDTLSLEVSFPYRLLKNLEEMGQNTPPPALPAPQGFLEPFHFHIEYVVAPITGDCNGDGRRDLADFAQIQNCFTGAGAGPLSPQCRCSDFQFDEDVDLGDYSSFRDAMSGP